jgi:hypothetical protein
MAGRDMILEQTNSMIKTQIEGSDTGVNSSGGKAPYAWRL